MDVTDDVTATLRAEAHHPPCVLESAGFCTEHSAKSRSIGYEKETSPTLRAGVVPATVYTMTTGSFAQVSEDKTPTVLARDYKDPTTVCYGIGRDTFNQGKNAKFAPTFEEELSPTLVAKGLGAAFTGYIVRRLTPTEYARLQGFPDAWGHPDYKETFTNDEYTFWMGVRNTHAAINGKQEKQYTREQMLKWYNGLHTDSAEYKMWGNGIALPPALYCMQGIAEVLRQKRAEEI